MKQTYDLIYSLGTDCACALYMNRFKLRRVSGPFDWLTHALFQTRMELILTHFQDFMNVKDMKFLEKDPTVLNDETHDYYENVVTDFYFYHDFKANLALDAQIGAVQQKYDRRIQRFYQQIHANNRVLLIWLAHNQATDDRLVLDYSEKLISFFQKPIDFLIIEHDATKADGAIERNALSPHVVKYRLFSYGYDEKGNPTTLGNEEALNPIFAQYELHRSLGEKLKNRALKVLFKGMLILTPVKAWRKKMKKQVAKYDY
jgi:hypothetical protein